MKRIDVSHYELYFYEERGNKYNNYWIFDQIEKKAKLIKNSNSDSIVHKEQDLIEKITADILKKLNIKCMNVELGINKGENCCVIDSFLSEGESLYDVKGVFAFNEITWGEPMNNLANSFQSMFDNFADKQYQITYGEVAQMYEDYIRIIFGDCILSNYDRHLGNIGVVYNEKTERFSLAPSYDNANSFLGCDIPIKYEVRVGIQNFKIKDVINYILQNHYHAVEDIIPLLANLAEHEINELVNKYELSPQKKEYIVDYINLINNFIKTSLGKIRAL